MKFKCIQTGNVYNFTETVDIAGMQRNTDYVFVPDEPKPAVVVPKPLVIPPGALARPATIAAVAPKPTGPDKPLPVPAVAPKAV